MMAAFSASAAGFLFAIGLGVGGMADPARVVGFLDVAGAWDPSLAFVMAGALGTYAPLRRRILRRGRPVCAPAFPALDRAAVDVRLVAGAGLFGVGWGLAGYCPGPALTSIAAGTATVHVFVAAMAAGMIAFEGWQRRATAASRGAPRPSA
jgi:uncharacterized membrane protein YedE/YeeE